MRVLDFYEQRVQELVDGEGRAGKVLEDAEDGLEQRFR